MEINGIARRHRFTPTPHWTEGHVLPDVDAQVVRRPESTRAPSYRTACPARPRGRPWPAPAIGKGRGKDRPLLRGEIFDVGRGSSSASPHSAVGPRSTSRREQSSIYIPAGCAHGFQSLTDPADIAYRIDRAHDPTEDVAIAWDDPELAITWPLPMTTMSERDLAAPRLAEALSALGHVARLEIAGLNSFGFANLTFCWSFGARHHRSPALTMPSQSGPPRKPSTLCRTRHM